MSDKGESNVSGVENSNVDSVKNSKVFVEVLDESEVSLVKEVQPFTLVRSGKVRDCYDIGYNVMAMVHSDRQSAFDRHIVDIPGKGAMLTAMSAGWFMILEDLGINTHFIDFVGNVMFVKKCEIFPVEMVIRQYITGSTKTSLWKHYSDGEREYCGIKFPDGLVKNQKLPGLVITPTTKGDVDEPISCQQIVERDLMNQEQMNECLELTCDIFKIGNMISDDHGLILVDTKYEFGLDSNGDIIICDEVHTCDSSRFWLADSYQEQFDRGEEPEKFDKDLVRDYVKQKCDPYTEELPEIPQKLINGVKNAYLSFYKRIFEDDFEETDTSEFSFKEYVEMFHERMAEEEEGEEEEENEEVEEEADEEET